MLKHNLILFFRNIKRYKSTFAINIIGLSSGLACVLLIALWVMDELQFDAFHENDKQLYQVWNKFENSRGTMVINWTPELLAETMAEKLPEVKYATAQTLPEWFAKTPLLVNGKIIKAPGVFGDEDYFKIFSYPLLQGTKEQVLVDINSIVISESLAKRLFGSTENVIGKTIEWNANNMNGTHQVSGIFKDIPSNSTTQFDFVLPFESWKKQVPLIGGRISWVSNNPATYIVLKEGTNIESFAKKIEKFSKQQDKEVTANLVMTKYSSNYLYGNFENGKQVSGRMDYVYLFSFIALFILIIACINFMNLSTANASRRLKEIGVKKALGSKRTTLIQQYFNESILTAFISLMISLIFVFLFIPTFNTITNKELSLNLSLESIGLAILVVLCTGIIAGSYPALHLSRFNPVSILKGQLKHSWAEGMVRKGLVVFQFSISIILIIAVLLVSKQVEYVQSKNLGMNKDNVVYFEQEGNLKKRSDVFLRELGKVPGILNVGSTRENVVGKNLNSTAGVRWSGNEEDRKSRFSELRIGFNFIETMGMTLKEGRAFSREFATDSTGIVFNEMAIKKMGIQNPIGKTVTYGGITYTIIGVLEDFHFNSLREKVNPMFFRLIQEERNLKYLARIEQEREKEALAGISEIYRKFNPKYPFEYKFLDNDFQAQYAAEGQVVSLSKYFALLAVLISCLGLFGLATFTAERRRKEISVRKVLGQSATRVTIMLSNEFAKLVFLSIIIALPVGYLLANNWLSGFAYKIQLEIWYFLAAGSLALFVALATVATQAIRAANKNPIDALRNE